jgi:hypothetical protein
MKALLERRPFLGEGDPLACKEAKKEVNLSHKNDQTSCD